MIHIAQVLSSLNTGGIEVWLKNLAMAIKRMAPDVRLDFVTLASSGGNLEKDISGQGFKIFHIPLSWRNLPGTIHRFTSFFRKNNYDVVHCQADYLSGIILPCAALAGVKRRFAHIHSTQFTFDADAPLKYKLPGYILKLLTLKFANRCFACSKSALHKFLNCHWQRKHGEVLHCALPIDELEKIGRISKSMAREMLGLPENDYIVLHAGRHSVQKNLLFLLEIFAYLAERSQNYRLVLAGEGPLTKTLREMTAQKRLDKQVVFLGMRNDVPLIMRACNLMLLPSTWEALPIVMLEALAMGLPIVASDHITREVEVVPGMISWHSLDQNAQDWAEVTEKWMDSPILSQKKCIERFLGSDFNIEISAKKLLRYYGY